MADFKQNNINHKPKGRFFWFVYAKGKPKEPSLWFATEIKIFEQYEDGKNSYILIPYSKSTYDGIYGVINTAKQRINFYKY